MVNRILRDDPSKSDMHNRQGITLDLMWKAMKDYDMYTIHRANADLRLADIALGGRFTCWVWLSES